MELLPDERKNLHFALNDAFTSVSDLQNLTLLELSVSLNAISALDTLPSMIRNVIEYFEKQNQSAALIAAARRASPTNVSLKVFGEAILQRLAAVAAPTWYPQAPNPFDTCFIEPGPQPFISRSTLRTFLQQLGSPGGFPILVVNGLSKTGKSYSLQFIGFLKRRLASYQLAWVDLKDEAYGEYKPEYLASDVAAAFGWGDALPQRPSTRYPKELTRWLLGRSNQAPGQEPFVIVLDGFHQPELYGETREFVQELIKQVAANTARIKLILLNYTDALLPPGLPPIRREALTTLSRPEIVEFFRSVATQKGQTPPDAVVEQIVDRVLSKVPADAPAYNELLNQQVTEAAALLLRSA